MRLALVLLLLLSLVGCQPSIDAYHLDGINLSKAMVSDFRNKFGEEDDRTPLYIMGVPIHTRLRFVLQPDDAKRITSAPGGPLLVDEGSSLNVIRVWLPLPKSPKNFDDAKEKWGDPAHTSIVQPDQIGMLPANLSDMFYSVFELNGMEIGLFYEGEKDQIAMITWAPHLEDSNAPANSSN